MNRFQRLRERHLEQILTFVDEVVEEYSGQSASLKTMTHYHMSTGGKRLRAVLPLAVAEALAHPAEPLIPFAAACEMIHNATLVHDDLQDRDTRRRGKPTVWTKFGESQAINLGDAMFFYAIACAQKLDESNDRKSAVIEQITRSTLRVIAGQENEFNLQTCAEPTLNDYVGMVEGKTSGLFALPMAGSAVLCDAPKQVVETLHAVANHMGVLFQVQDDVLDLYGDKGRTIAGSDIGEGKRSLLVVHALNHGESHDVERLRTILDTPRSETTVDNIEEARTIFSKTGALRFCLDTIVQRRNLAITAVESLDHSGLRDLVSETCTVLETPIQAQLETHNNTH